MQKTHIAQIIHRPEYIHVTLTDVHNSKFIEIFWAVTFQWHGAVSITEKWPTCQYMYSTEFWPRGQISMGSEFYMTGVIIFQLCSPRRFYISAKHFSLSSFCTNLLKYFFEKNSCTNHLGCSLGIKYSTNHGLAVPYDGINLSQHWLK